jgi:hypothetical protein
VGEGATSNSTTAVDFEDRERTDEVGAGAAAAAMEEQIIQERPGKRQGQQQQQTGEVAELKQRLIVNVEE